MSEKYIKENKTSYTVTKNSKSYANTKKLDDAIAIRDMLVKTNWNTDEIPEIIKINDSYGVLTVLDGKVHLIARYRKEPDKNTIAKLVKKHRRNPNNSKYGLNISKVFSTYIVQKQIAGDEYVFGYYDKLEDAEFVRNFLMDNNWDVSQFEKISYCDETDTYRVIKVIDDKVYVLGSSKTDNFNLNDIYREFLTKISKHKYGLADYPHLSALTDSINNLEDDFGVKASDEVWSFEDINDKKSALNKIIFSLTPFQQSIYDAIDGETSFDDIKKKMIRYSSKNFEEKISRHLDELIDRGLVEKTGDVYIKIKN